MNRASTTTVLASELILSLGVPTKTPAGHRLRTPMLFQSPGGQSVSNHQAGGWSADQPQIDSPEAAAQALCDYFLANADRGDNAVNDESCR